MANEVVENSTEDAERRYKTPALEKGLDILELLAQQDEPLTTSQIAAGLNRSVSELFRMVLTLESRGYIAQIGGKEGYGLTNKMFSLGVAQTSIKTLIELALPAMKTLVNQSGQSCHMTVASNDQIVVVSRIESPREMGFSVRVGYRRPLVDSTSGIVLYAFNPEDKRQVIIEKISATASSAVLKEYLANANQAIKLGFVKRHSDFVKGVVDFSSPILGNDGAVAALTVPYVSCVPELCSEQEALDLLLEATAKISALYQTEGR